MAERPQPYAHLDRDDVWRGVGLLAARAAEHGVHVSTLAYAWVLSDPRVTAMLVGPRRPGQLDSAGAALDLHLADDQRADLAGCFSPA